MTHPALAASLYDSMLQEAMQAFRAQRYDESKAIIKRAIEMDAKQPKAYQQLMQICEKIADVDGLIDALVRWLTVSPGDLRAVQELINLCLNNKRYAPAIDQLKSMLRLDPDNVMLTNLICLVFIEAKEYGGGLPYFERIFKMNPNQTPEVVKAFAWVLYQAGKYERALEVAQSVAAHFAHDEEMVVLLASSYLALGKYDAHQQVYDEGAKRLPDNARIVSALGRAQLLCSGMKEGFDAYETRHKVETHPPRPVPLPWWRGESVRGKGIVLWAEQGVGDVTMFATLLPWLLAQQPSRVRLGVEKKMMTLFARSFPGIEVMDIDDPVFVKPAEGYDFQAPMGDLMRYGLPHDVPSKHAPIFKPDATLRGTLRTRYEAAAKARGAKRIVGIAWHTRNDMTNMLRNIALEQWAPLLALPHIQFVSLQYGDHAADIAAVNRQFAGALLHDDAVDALADTDAAIAQVAAMDEVISIQNATSHFGGSLGVPTTLLLSVAADWRWGAERTDSLWYQSVRIIRQRKALEWDEVMQQAASQL